MGQIKNGPLCEQSEQIKSGPLCGQSRPTEFAILGFFINLLVGQRMSKCLW
jgi:hypothetical protein